MLSLSTPFNGRDFNLKLNQLSKIILHFPAMNVADFHKIVTKKCPHNAVPGIYQGFGDI